MSILSLIQTCNLMKAHQHLSKALPPVLTSGLSGSASDKEPDCQCRRCKRHGFDPTAQVPALGPYWCPCDHSDLPRSCSLPSAVPQVCLGYLPPWLPSHPHPFQLQPGQGFLTLQAVTPLGLPTSVLCTGHSPFLGWLSSSSASNLNINAAHILPDDPF